MVSPLDTRRLLRESAPVAVILLFWVVLSSIAQPVIATGLLRAGIIMALLYIVVRGVTLAQTHPATSSPDDLEGILRENVRVAIPAGIWFLATHLVFFIEHVWDMFGIPGVATSPANGIAYIFTGAGVAAVLLYAIAVGLPRIRGTVSNTGNGTADTAPADD